LQAEFLSHVGAVRKNNEDAIFCDVKAGLFVVADGIGGRRAGEVASATAVRLVAEKFWESPAAPADELMREAFYQANDILHRSGKEKKLRGMGTTMTAAAVRGVAHSPVTGNGGTVECLAAIREVTSTGAVRTGWVPTVDDMLADDWYIC